MNKLYIYALTTIISLLGSGQVIAMEEHSPSSDPTNLSAQEGQPALRRDFTRTGLPTIILIAKDNVTFSVALPLVEHSETLKELIELRSETIEIPLPSIDSQSLEATLFLLETGGITKDLQLERLIEILIVQDCLDIQTSKEKVIKAILNTLSWHNDSLEKFFGNPQIPNSDKEAILASLACKLKWDMEGITGFYKNQNMPKYYTLALLKALIEAKPLQLVQVIHQEDFVLASSVIQEKRCKDLDINPLDIDVIEYQPTEVAKREHADLKLMLNDDYNTIKKELQKIYPVNPGHADMMKALLDAVYPTSTDE